MDFPVYRKYPNEKHFFRIHSHEEFEELFIMGSRYGLRRKKADTYPDRLLIQDMLNKKDGNWLASSEEEFEDALAVCKRDRALLQSS